MEKLTTYHLFLNYLTKQSFCQSILENTSILELDIVDVEFYLNSTLAISSSQNMIILLYILKI